MNEGSDEILPNITIESKQTTFSSIRWWRNRTSCNIIASTTCHTTGKNSRRNEIVSFRTDQIGWQKIRWFCELSIQHNNLSKISVTIIRIPKVDLSKFNRLLNVCLLKKISTFQLLPFRPFIIIISNLLTIQIIYVSHSYHFWIKHHFKYNPFLFWT